MLLWGATALWSGGEAQSIIPRQITQGVEGETDHYVIVLLQIYVPVTIGRCTKVGIPILWISALQDVSVHRNIIAIRAAKEGQVSIDTVPLAHNKSAVTV